MKYTHEYNGHYFYSETELGKLIELDIDYVTHKLKKYTSYKGLLPGDDRSFSMSDPCLELAQAHLSSLSKKYPSLPKEPTIKQALEICSEEDTGWTIDKYREARPWMPEELPYINMRSIEHPSKAKQVNPNEFFIEGIFEIRPLHNDYLANALSDGNPGMITDTLAFTKYCSRPELVGQEFTVQHRLESSFHDISAPLYSHIEFITLVKEMEIPLTSTKSKDPESPHIDIENLKIKLLAAEKEKAALKLELKKLKTSNKLAPQGQNSYKRSIQALAKALVSSLTDKPQKNANMIIAALAEKGVENPHKAEKTWKKHLDIEG